MRDPELVERLRKLDFEPVVADDRVVTPLIRADLQRADVVSDAMCPDK